MNCPDFSDLNCLAFVASLSNKSRGRTTTNIRKRLRKEPCVICNTVYSPAWRKEYCNACGILKGKGYSDNKVTEIKRRKIVIISFKS